MADEAPTKEGQNIIIKNLSSIFMTLMGLALAALFAWGQQVSKENGETKIVVQQLKDEIQRLEAKIDGQVRGIRADIQDNANDIEEVKLDAEHVHDDLKTRMTKQEDWVKFFEQYKRH